MKKFFSFSGGVESTTMAVLFGNKADGIFADTGFEHEELYERIELIENWCKAFHREDFKIHKVKNIEYNSLPEYIIEAKFYPNFGARYCTRMFKIEPIDDYLKDIGEVELMIGLNSDEQDQRTGNHGNMPNIKYSYPLADVGLNRLACIEILKKVNLNPSFPAYMKRGGCKGCYFKSKKEYEAMALLNPKEFKEIETLENDIQDKRVDFFSIIPDIKMSEIRLRVSNMLFKPEEMYPTLNNVTKCGVFCHR